MLQVSRRVLSTLTLTLLVCAPGARAGAQESAAPPVPATLQESGRIQPGDQVVLNIWREPDLSGTFTVDAAGQVSLPRLGMVPASDYTGDALQRLVRDELGRYLRNPTIEVRVLRRVGVQGEVRLPDLYMVDLTMTLREVIAEAGGITEFGNPNRIAIIRDGERISLGEGEQARYVAAELRSGDQVVVGRRSWFEINSLAIVSTAAVVVSVVVPLLRSAF
jgi:protein involved in polysaccharide export with SLBB domain